MDTEALRGTLGSFLTGVTVVTTTDEAGNPYGFTANSFTSISLDPPLVLVCPAIQMFHFSVYEQCSHFVINILSEHQQDVSGVFSSPIPDRFKQVKWHKNAAGCPVIDGCTAYVSCKTYRRVEDVGDHIILIGLVQEHSHTNIPGLGYNRGGYFNMSLERQAARMVGNAKHVVVGAIIEDSNRVLLQQSDAGYFPPHIHTRGGCNSLDELQQRLADSGFAVRFGPAYAVFEDVEEDRLHVYYRCWLLDSEEVGDGKSDQHQQAGTQMQLTGEYFSCDQLRQLPYASDALVSMMTRYATESHSGVFGMYLGNVHTGSVHAVN